MKNHARPLMLLSALLLGSAVATPATTVRSSPSNQRLSVLFQSIDPTGLVLLNYGSLKITAKLAGIRLKNGASGVLGMLLPEGMSLQAEIIQKGSIPSVILWKGTTNLNQELLMQGVAQVIK